MNSQLSSSRAELEFAEVALRDVLTKEFGDEAGADAKSLRRMLVHLVNMQEAICISPEHHANVAKRLADFAAMTSRMVDRNPAAASKMTRLSEMLRAVSSRLRDSVSVVTVTPEPIVPEGVDFGLDQKRGRLISRQSTDRTAQYHHSTEAQNRLRS